MTARLNCFPMSQCADGRTRARVGHGERRHLGRHGSRSTYGNLLRSRTARPQRAAMWTEVAIVTRPWGRNQTGRYSVQDGVDGARRTRTADLLGAITGQACAPVRPCSSESPNVAQPCGPAAIASDPRRTPCNPRERQVLPLLPRTRAVRLARRSTHRSTRSARGARSPDRPSARRSGWTRVWPRLPVVVTLSAATTASRAAIVSAQTAACARSSRSRACTPCRAAVRRRSAARAPGPRSPQPGRGSCVLTIFFSSARSRMSDT